jgi:hypothetical protein
MISSRKASVRKIKRIISSPCKPQSGFKKFHLFLSLSLIFNLSSIAASEIHGSVASSIGKLTNAVVYIEKIESKSFLPPIEPAIYKIL